MKVQIDRCMGCMNEKLYSGPCAVCGYTDNDADPAECLAPKTLLADRYIIGKLISRGGEGALYLAFDKTENKAVEIKEFMPDTLCVRGADGESVEIKEGSMPLFKSYLSEFADLHKTMITSMGESCLRREYEIFASNGTGYVVTEHTDAVTLEEYLNQHGGKLTWNEIKEKLPALLDTLNELHEKGIVHRGISPSTIFVTNDGKPILTSIDISAARTEGSQINCEIFPGYAPSEQYDLSERHGSWTDVYSLCAVLYRVLTGEVPPDANARKNEDMFVQPYDINDAIPKYISDTISDGMKIDRTNRIHNITALRTRLYTVPTAELPEKPAEPPEPEYDGPVTPKAAVRFDPDDDDEEFRKHQPSRSSKQTSAKKKKNKQKSSNVGTIIGIFIFFAMVIALVIAIIYFSQEAKNASEGISTSTSVTTQAPETKVTTSRTTAATTAPPATTAGGDKLLMPDFVSRFFNSSLENRYSMLKFEAEYDYTDEYAEGVIYGQDIDPGTSVTSGTTVHIKVSKGPAFTYLPDYVGMKLSEYTAKLVQLGVRFETEAEETDEVKQGYVSRCSKEVGDQVYISENEIVIVYYAVTPAKTDPPVTEPPEKTQEPDDAEENGDEPEESVAGD